VFVAAGLPASYTGTAMAGNPQYTLQQQDTGTSRAANETEIANSSGIFTPGFNLSSVANWTQVTATFRP